MIDDVMWTDASRVPRVGEMRGGPEDAVEVRTPTRQACPFCHGQLYVITGYTERVMITAIHGVPVNGRQLVGIKDIPATHAIFSCSGCGQNYTQANQV